MNADKKFTHICIVIYNRFHNLRHWLECWEKCDQENAKVIVIHNADKPDSDYSDLCEKHQVQYIKRHNIGFDIGAFQDVCKNRLKGFPDWERILWMTDDTFPMAFDFVEKFNKTMKPGVGVACMYISPYVTRHIRTTGFMIDRPTAEKLQFPADPVISKQHCYLFEHRAKGNVFYNQVKSMGLQVEMVADNKTSPLWDSGYHRRIDRQKEHEKTFGEVKRDDKILFICPIYKNYPQIISSLLLQTHKNWVLMLIHDGPDVAGVQKFVPEDPRIIFSETPKHGGAWGHYIRQVGIEQFKDFADYIVITNPDNYHTPIYCEYLLRGFGDRDSSIAVYCNEMTHSYKAWQTIPCRLEKGYIDIAGIMIRTWAAAEVGWQDINSHSADWVFISDLIKKYGVQRFHRIKGNLFVHN